MNGRARAVKLFVVVLVAIALFTWWLSRLDVTWQVVIAVLAVLNAVLLGLLAIAQSRKRP